MTTIEELCQQYTSLKGASGASMMRVELNSLTQVGYYGRVCMGHCSGMSMHH